jgi:hypothetical protein
MREAMGMGTESVHGFGAVVLSQGIWMITVGVLLARSAPEQAQAGL